MHIPREALLPCCHFAPLRWCHHPGMAWPRAISSNSPPCHASRRVASVSMSTRQKRVIHKTSHVPSLLITAPSVSNDTHTALLTPHHRLPRLLPRLDGRLHRPPRRRRRREPQRYRQQAGMLSLPPPQPPVRSAHGAGLCLAPVCHVHLIPHHHHHHHHPSFRLPLPSSCQCRYCSTDHPPSRNCVPSRQMEPRSTMSRRLRCRARRTRP